VPPASRRARPSIAVLLVALDAGARANLLGRQRVGRVGRRTRRHDGDDSLGRRLNHDVGRRLGQPVRRRERRSS